MPPATTNGGSKLQRQQAQGQQRQQQQHQTMLSATIDGVPNWVSRGASTGDIFAADQRMQREKDTRTSDGFLRLPAIARNPQKAVQEELELKRAGKESARTARKTKGIMEAMPLEETSLLPLVGNNPHDAALEKYAAAAADAARRHKTHRHQVYEEEERKKRAAMQHRKFSNKVQWRDITQGNRTRVELTAKNLHKHSSEQQQQHQQQQDPHHHQQFRRLSNHNNDDHNFQRFHSNNADPVVSPYSKALIGNKNAPLVNLVQQSSGGGAGGNNDNDSGRNSPRDPHDNSMANNASLSNTSKPVFVIDGQQREEEEEAFRRAQQEKQRLLQLQQQRSGSADENQDASLTSLPAMASPEDGSLRLKGEKSGGLVSSNSPPSGSGGGKQQSSGNNSTTEPVPLRIELSGNHPPGTGDNKQRKQSAQIDMLSVDSSGDHVAGAEDGHHHGVVYAEQRNHPYNNDDDHDYDHHDHHNRNRPSELTMTYLGMLEKNESFERRNIERKFGEGLQSMAPQRDRISVAVATLARERRGIEYQEQQLRASTILPEYKSECQRLEKLMLQDREFALFHERQRPSCSVLPRPGGKININTSHSTTYVVEWRHRNTNPLDLVAVLLDEKNNVIGTASKNNTFRSREGVTCVRPFSSASPSLVRLGPVTHRSCLQISLVTLPPETRTVLFSVVVPWQQLHQHETATANQLIKDMNSSGNSGGDEAGDAAAPNEPRRNNNHRPHPPPSHQQQQQQLNNGSNNSNSIGFGAIGRGWLTVFDALPLVQTVGSHTTPGDVPRLEEVTTVEVVPDPRIHHDGCVAMTLGCFALDHRSKAPAVFHALEDRYVGGRRTADNIAHFCGLWRADPFACIREEMYLARSSILGQLVTVWELFERHSLCISERQGTAENRKLRLLHQQQQQQLEQLRLKEASSPTRQRGKSMMTASGVVVVNTPAEMLEKQQLQQQQQQAKPSEPKESPLDASITTAPPGSAGSRRASMLLQATAPPPGPATPESTSHAAAAPAATLSSTSSPLSSSHPVPQQQQQQQQLVFDMSQFWVGAGRDAISAEFRRGLAEIRQRLMEENLCKTASSIM